MGWGDPYGSWAWSLTVLFAVRVLRQAVQRWMPQPFLPPFETFQGSRLPYWLLLPLQLVILGAMARFAWRVQTDRLAPRRRLGLWLVWAGAVYMARALGRMAVGLPDAHAWFRAWIPAFFHVVLAAFVLVVSIYHLREGASTTGRAR